MIEQDKEKRERCTLLLSSPHPRPHLHRAVGKLRNTPPTQTRPKGANFIVQRGESLYTVVCHSSALRALRLQAGGFVPGELAQDQRVAQQQAEKRDRPGDRVAYEQGFQRAVGGEKRVQP